jgi:hypothetical protein
MSQDPQGDQRPALSTEGAEKPPLHTGSGCLGAIAVLWGVALLMVGLLVTAVSGYCSIVVFSSGGPGAGDFGGIVLGGVLIGIFLCAIGYFMMRRFS